MSLRKYRMRLGGNAYERAIWRQAWYHTQSYDKSLSSLLLTKQCSSVRIDLSKLALLSTHLQFSDAVLRHRDALLTIMSIFNLFHVLFFLSATLAAPMPVAVPVVPGPLASQDGISFIDCSECSYGYTVLPGGAHTCTTNVQVYCSP